jgi:hypothetical protein
LTFISLDAASKAMKLAGTPKGINRATAAQLYQATAFDEVRR